MSISLKDIYTLHVLREIGRRLRPSPAPDPVDVEIEEDDDQDRVSTLRMPVLGRRKR